jgi:hypothetical protein
LQTSDGQYTRFGYLSNNDPVAPTARLSRLWHPSDAASPVITDYGYDTLGRIVSVKDSLTNDVIAAGVRASNEGGDGTPLLTQVSYDSIGRVSGITLPAATLGATRQAHTYNYFVSTPGSVPGSSEMHVTNASEPNGFSRRVTYDATLRTVTDTDAANLTSTTVLRLS